MVMVETKTNERLIERNKVALFSLKKWKNTYGTISGKLA